MTDVNITHSPSIIGYVSALLRGCRTGCCHRKDGSGTGCPVHPYAFVLGWSGVGAGSVHYRTAFGGCYYWRHWERCSSR